MRTGFGIVVHCCVGLVLTGAAMAQTDCDARAQLQTDEVTREFSARAPGKGTGPAQQAWSQGLHDALEAVAKRHEACRRANAAASDPAQMRQRDACLDANRRQFEALDQRYQGRNLGAQEQGQRRSEEQKLLDARLACTRGL